MYDNVRDWIIKFDNCNDYLLFFFFFFLDGVIKEGP